MSFFNSEKKPIYFVTKEFKEKLFEKSDLVLSPEFYWAKKTTLNLRYTYEASKMATSVFDGILPAGTFKFKVFKLDKNEFIFIAYDIQNIIKELEIMGIDMHLVEKIYTAQSEFMDKDIALRINGKYAIASSKGVITYVPLKFLNSSIEMNVDDVLEEKKLTSNYIYSKSFQNININSKESNLILWLLTILVSMLFLNVLQTQKERNFLVEQKNSLVEKYNLPKTTFQIKSLQDELSRIDLQQNKLKEAIIYLGKFGLSEKEFFSSLLYKKTNLKFSVKLDSTEKEQKFKKYITKKYKILKTGRFKRDYMVEVQL